MKSKVVSKTSRYCGRSFTGEEISWIQDLIAREPQASRVRLSALVSEGLSWLRPDGRLKEMSCRVAMLRMQRDGLISLPPPRNRNANGRTRPALTTASDPRAPVTRPAGSLGKLVFQRVEKPQDSKLWNELIERHHYIGYKPLSGDQIRYLVFGDGNLLAALGFGSAAWKIAPRDRFIGWSLEQRRRNLHLVVNNARFLIFPWVTSRNLASRILAGVVRQLPQDWQARYGYRPVLLETFIDRERFRGICYRAANWVLVGQTQGRGKLDRQHQYSLPVKDIFLYPLDKSFRQTLVGGPQ